MFSFTSINIFIFVLYLLSSLLLYIYNYIYIYVQGGAPYLAGLINQLANGWVCTSIRRHFKKNDVLLMSLISTIISSPTAWIPSGKRLPNYGKSPFLMGKPTINCHFQSIYSDD